MDIMYLFRLVLLPRKSIYHCMWSATVCNSYPTGCPHVRGDNPQPLASGLSYVQVDKHGITILYPPTLVKTFHITRYFMLKMVKVV